MDRWTTVKRIHQSALDKDPSERAAFVDESCAGDETLPAIKVFRYAEAGDLDAAFKHLHLALDAHDPGMTHLAVAPQWDSLRAGPRFNQCLVRMKLRSA